MYELFIKVHALYEKGKGAFPEPILNLKWDYETNGYFDIHKVAKEINGYFLEDIPEHPADKKAYKKGTLVPSFVYLLEDGRTSCGSWIYSASYTEAGNMAARRKKTDPTGLGLYPEWAWTWPVNRRIIYNRAAVDLDGNPRDPKRPLLKWDADGKRWIGDVPDNAVPPMGTDGAYPFIMKPDGVASIFGPGLKDGPFPEHYEPLECPIEKNVMSNQRISPVIKIFEGGPDKFTTCDPRYPFVCSTYRVTEHWQTGVLTRWLPWLIEAEPQMFCEMSLELAKLKEIKNGERVIVETPRGKVEAVAIVTSRLKPFQVAGQIVHQIGIPWHYGWIHPKDGGDSANLLTPTVGDPNTMIPESKAFMANVSKLTKKPAKKGLRKGGDINDRRKIVLDRYNEMYRLQRLSDGLQAMESRTQKKRLIGEATRILLTWDHTWKLVRFARSPVIRCFGTSSLINAVTASSLPAKKWRMERPKEPLHKTRRQAQSSSTPK